MKQISLIELEETLQQACNHKCGHAPPNNEQEYQACLEKKCLTTIWYDNAISHIQKGWLDFVRNNLKRLRKEAGLCGECGQLIQVEDINTASDVQALRLLLQEWKRRNREASPSDYIVCWKCFAEQDKKGKKKLSDDDE